MRIKDEIKAAVADKKEFSNAAKPKRSASAPRVILTVVAKGGAKEVVQMYGSKGAGFSTVFSGEGTATSEIRDILGLDTPEKDVILTLAEKRTAREIFAALGDRLATSRGSRGIAMSMKLGAVSSLVKAALEVGAATKKGGRKMDGNEYSLVTVIVNQGFSDEVIGIAKKNGARGGTMVRAHHSDAEETARLFGSDFTREREIIFMLVPKEQRNEISDAITAELGVRTEANGIVLSLPVEDVAKID